MTKTVKARIDEGGFFDDDRRMEKLDVVFANRYLDAYDQLIENGVDIGFYYTTFLSPLNPELIEELKQKDLVIVPELNYMGQFSMYLRSYGIKAESITQYVGLPFKVGDLVEKITDKAGQARKESVTV